MAVLVPTDGNRVAGTITFTQRRDEVEISGRITGLTPGKHGFHVHQYGDLSNLETGESAGGHFNPTDMPHGVLRLNGPQSIVGRAIVVHAKADEFTQPSGDAGDRVALGVIGIAEPRRGGQSRGQ